MENKHISYKETGYFSKIMLDYLDEKESINTFYNRFPKLDNFEAQFEEKQEHFSLEQRLVLVSSLKKQYANTDLSESTYHNINKLKSTNTFTITTGHQLNLFSGPLYFLYKIVSVINLCKELKNKYPKQNFVPIYWMASEDHDFEEIQYFNFKDQKINWEKKASGAVGRLNTEGLDEVYKEFSSLLNSGKNADELRCLFKEAYLQHDNLADASRYLVNTLFSSYGLVVVDGDDNSLKKLFKPYVLKELKEKVTFKEVKKTNEKLTTAGYPIQVHARDINLFYIGDNYRERIEKYDKNFIVNNTSLNFSSAEDVIKNTEETNDVISGNALLRPLYQEVILPNLCYVGGGGELAYWMQLKSVFNEFKVPFPMLLMRNSALLVSEKQLQKANKLNINIDELFLSQNELISKKINERSEVDFNFDNKREQLIQNFKELKKLTLQTDPSFEGAVNAQEKKQLNGLNYLEKRLLKAEKRRMKDVVTRIELLQNELFPNQSLEERQLNFSDYYETHGASLINILLDSLNPLEPYFTVIKL